MIFSQLRFVIQAPLISEGSSQDKGAVIGESEIPPQLFQGKRLGVLSGALSGLCGSNLNGPARMLLADTVKGKQLISQVPGGWWKGFSGRPSLS
jgi:hypothetical protein